VEVTAPRVRYRGGAYLDSNEKNYLIEDFKCAMTDQEKMIEEEMAKEILSKYYLKAR
jgi:hypothetical protein